MEEMVLAFVEMFGELFDAATSFVAAADVDAMGCAHEACGRGFMVAFGMA